MLAALSHIQPEELQHVMDEIEAEVRLRRVCMMYGWDCRAMQRRCCAHTHTCWLTSPNAKPPDHRWRRG